jgi:hypothetical protein
MYKNSNAADALHRAVRPSDLKRSPKKKWEPKTKKKIKSAEEQRAIIRAQLKEEGRIP